jgi:hypothetical protein
MELEIRTEPDNPVQQNALGLWVRNRGLFGPKRFQVGYVRSELADEIRDMLSDGWEISGHILEVTGGGPDKWYGVNIELRLTPPLPLPGSLIVGFFSAFFGVIVAGLVALFGSMVGVVRLTIAAWRRVIPLLARKTRETTKQLLKRFSALSVPRRIAVVGSFASIGGTALWTLGVLLTELSGTFSPLRPIGFVTVVVGLGAIAIGVLFSIAER